LQYGSDNPLVSVIIPTYNCAEYVSEAIESMLAQTYRPLEVVVLDDGSTDGTRDRVAQFGDRVKYVYQENAGPSAARNAGIATSKGKIIALLDADDTCAPHRIERQMRVLMSHPDVGFVASDTRVTDINGTLTGKAWGAQVAIRDGERGDVRGKPCEGVDNAFVLDADALRRYIEAPFFAPATLLFDRGLFEEVGRYDESLWRGEDFDLMIRLLQVTQLGFVCEPLYFYRKGREGSMTDNHPDTCASLARALEKLEESSDTLNPRMRNLIHARIAGKHMMLAAYRVWANDPQGAARHFRVAVRRCLRPVSLACLALAHTGPLGRPLLKRLADRILKDELAKPESVPENTDI